MLETESVSPATGAGSPVPDSGMLSGLPSKLPLMITLALRAPTALGLKLTLPEQVAIGAGAAAQLGCSVKSVSTLRAIADLPVVGPTDISEIVMVLLPVLLIEND